MRPLLLKGHTRPLTCLKFNREGDLLFSAAKDHTPCVWYSNNGERLGTYKGHVGAVSGLDVNFSTTRLLTASADTTARLWDCETGKELFKFTHASAVRTCGFAEGDRMILTAQDQTFGQQPTIFIYNLVDDLSQQEEKPVRAMFQTDMTKQNIALWGNLNQTVISGGDDGIVRVWDVETGKQIETREEFKKPITGLQFSKDRTMLIASSSDQTAKLFDVKGMSVLKTYQSDRPLNDAAIHPTMNLVIVGGGQEASAVTTTAARSGRFETDFHHLVYTQKLGEVKGHFGPINTLAFNPDGKSFASGSEDGYIRLHHFDKEFFSFPQY